MLRARKTYNSTYDYSASERWATGDGLLTGFPSIRSSYSLLYFNMGPKSANLSPAAFAHAQLSLLVAEQSAEVAETTLLLSDSPPTTLARAGFAVLNLTPVSQRTGLGGKTVLELGLDPAVSSAEKGGSDLPDHGIRTGDIVRVGEQPSGGAKKREKAEMKGKGIEGVVTRVGERAVWVALGQGSNGDEDVDIPGGKLWVYVWNKTANCPS